MIQETSVASRYARSARTSRLSEKDEAAETEHRFNQIKSDVEQARKRFAEADQMVEQAMREFESDTARGRLNRFIRDKVVDGDYSKHLGIIATIRKDFGQLAQIVAESETEDAAREEYRKATEEYQAKFEHIISHYGQYLSDTERQSLESKPVETDLRLFNRIILYIDDLDRCPSDKVVEVLQAIHLLLYFHLFVVVVAVDARWVSRALTEQFPELLEENIIIWSDAGSDSSSGVPDNHEKLRGAESDDNGGQADFDSRTATSQDYLEKIFQIPYWVRPMTANASKEYVEGIVAADVTNLAVDPLSFAADEKLTDTTGQDIIASPEDHHVDLKPTARWSGTVGEETGDVPQHEQPESSTPPGVEADKRITKSMISDLKEETDERTTVSMFLTEHEARLLKEFSPFIGGTPRRGIRFVNVYRLIKTSLPEDLQKILVGNNGESLIYQTLIAQLAIVTGAPKTAWIFFEHLTDKNGGMGTVGDLVGALEKDQRLTRYQDRVMLIGALTRLIELLGQAGLHKDMGTLETMRNLAPIVRRYSFTARPQ